MEIFINNSTVAAAEIYPLSADKKPPVYINEKALKAGPVWIHPAAENAPAFVLAQKKDNCPETTRRLGGDCATILLKQKTTACNLHLEDLEDSDAEAFLEGFLLGAYSFQKYKSEKNEISRCNLLLKTKSSETPQWVTKIINRVDSVNFARELTGASPAEMYPLAFLDSIKQRFFGTAVKVEIYTGKQLDEMGMAGVNNVGRAGLHAPAMGVLRYVTDPSLPLIALVGKGITFDMGGMNIKTGRDVSGMRMDMAGAAAVCGAFDILRRGDKPQNIMGVVLLAENLPDTNALLPGEVLKYSDGTTVHITNTDAEGRLLLADGILYAKKYSASRIIDIATLTGAIGTALGSAAAGVFGDDGICQALCATGKKNGDLLWQLPLFDRYAQELKTDYADIKNSCETSAGGSIIAALFLKRFAGDTPWAHIDMANTSAANKPSGYHNPGPTGYGVRLLADFLEETV